MTIIGLAAAAAIVLVEIGSGRVLRQEGDVHLRLSPGSTIKPFVLHVAGARREHICSRILTLAGRRMDCTHPPVAHPLKSAEALAYSCNSYFSFIGQTADDERLIRSLQSCGFVFDSRPATAETRQLAALGEFGVTVSPLELARAYARLAATGGVAGLHEAVEYGTAQQARVEGLAVAGKTGTSRTHAWFAGYAPVSKPRVAIVVLAGEGTGGNAAAPKAAWVLKEWFASPSQR
jgi:cell division protein FtsI/penicillin-binding protein 2